MDKPNDDITVIVPKNGEETELNRLASIFHQDFGLLNYDPDEMAMGFFKSLSNKERISLRKQLIDLLDEYPGRKQKGLLKAWFRMGAEWWDNKFNLRLSIENWATKLDQYKR